VAIGLVILIVGGLLLFLGLKGQSLTTFYNSLRGGGATGA
jgi:hypothetical protein